MPIDRWFHIVYNSGTFNENQRKENYVMPKTELSTAFDTVLEALKDAGVTMDDREEYLLMTINGRNYQIDIKSAEDNEADNG